MAWELKVKPDDLRLVDASAGSGKTHTLMDLVGELVSPEGGNEDAGCILATTFTDKAADELRQRIRRTLLESDRPDAAQQAAKASNGLIGTVNGVAGRILSDYAIDAGMSPQLEVLPDDAADMIFNRAVSGVMDARADEIGPVAYRLGFSAVKRGQFDKTVDWRDEVRKIVDRARANGISSVKLAESQQESLRTAKRWFDGSVELTLDGIVGRIKEHESELDREDVRSGTSGYFKSVKEFLKFPSWPNAVKVADCRICESDDSPIRGIAEGMRDDLVHSTGMRDDVVKMINLVFEIAIQGMMAYRTFKERYGLIDFTDQESELLRLLKKDEFKAKLSERVHRVLVDEFQDTSPIQLALFSKLGEVAGGKMTWVGDPKQSIYGFRGADPALMAKAASRIDKKNREHLDKSWRSKAELVRFSNTLFENAFSGVPGCDGTVLLDIPEKREKSARGGEIEAWMLGAKNAEGRSAQLVEGIVRLHEGQGVPYGEIAVLMRQGTDCAKLAAALSARGVPVATGGGTLFKTDEVRLAMAAYRYAVDQYDTVALATIAAQLIDPKGWLDAVSGDPAKALEEWKNKCQMEKGIGDIVAMTPLELLDKVIAHFGIDVQARKMGEGGRRVGNLEELRAKCAQYMASASLSGLPATHAGFIACTDGDDSEEASVQGANSVTVITYHKAKGLEWPTVILATLEGSYKRNPFNLTVVEAAEFDPADPLKDRKLRWIPCPFGDLGSDFKATLMRSNGEFSAEFDRIHDDEREERKRLMYVGVTRAKDRLVFAPQVKFSTAKTPKPPSVQAAWLDDLTASSFFSGNWKTVSGKDVWTMAGEKFDVVTRLYREVPEIAPVKYEKSAGEISTPIEKPLYKLAPSSQEVEPVKASVGEEIPLGTSLFVKDFKFTGDLGDCFHNYMAVAVPGKDDPALAEALIERWGQKDVITANELVACGAKLRELIAEKWPGSTVETEIPMSLVNENGQLSEGYIDMLVRAADGKYEIIDHKVVKEMESLVHVEKYAKQQNVYKKAIIGDGHEVISVYLNLPHQGRLAEIKFE